MATPWLNTSGQVITDAGLVVLCDSCPCGVTPPAARCLLWNDPSTTGAPAGAPGNLSDDIGEAFLTATGVSVDAHSPGTSTFLNPWTGDLFDYTLVVLPAVFSDPSWWHHVIPGTGTGTGITPWPGRIVLLNQPLYVATAGSWAWISGLTPTTGLDLDYAESAVWSFQSGGVTGDLVAEAHQLSDGVPLMGPLSVANYAAPLLGGNVVYSNSNFPTIPHITQNDTGYVDWVLVGQYDLLRLLFDFTGTGSEEHSFHENLLYKPLPGGTGT